MNKKEIEALVNLRQGLIAKFTRLKDYKSNKNAIMREQDHAKLLHETIVNIDNILKEHVSFDNKK
jgi:hypothetical protein